MSVFRGSRKCIGGAAGTPPAQSLDAQAIWSVLLPAYITKETSKNTEAKREAGLAAARLVEPGMKVGLGTGSTATFAIAELGRRNREKNLQLTCVATSFQSSLLAEKAGLTLVPPGSIRDLELSIDGPMKSIPTGI